ncbi:MAG: LOG family protein [Planctomycetota bacterium]|nr:LOG family protein [Planctomycetota bacterium]
MPSGTILEDIGNGTEADTFVAAGVDVYKPGLPPAPVQEKIRELIGMYGSTEDEPLAMDMIVQVLKLVRDGATHPEWRMLSTAVRELRRAFKLFRPYRNVRKVSIFGSARVPRGAPEYVQAMNFSAEMVRRGFMVITGGGPGIMEAGHGGAGRERSFGVNIRLPFEQRANPIIEGDEKLINFRYFFTRKITFVREADAIALFPGGFGTHDEGFEALTLVQTGKSQMIPIVFIDRPGGTYWRAFADYIARYLLKPGYIEESDLSLFKVTDDVGFACDEICGFYRRYHSLRYIGDDLAIRMTSPLTEETVGRMNAGFSDIVEAGHIRQVQASARENRTEPEIKSLPRLRFRFNRRSFGRLRQLIDEINRA